VNHPANTANPEENAVIGPPTRLSQPSPTPARHPGTSEPPHHLTAAPSSNGGAARGGQPKSDGQARPATLRREPSASNDVCRLLSLLADRTRLKILRILAGGERPVVSLTGELGLPQPTVSHHLAWLRMMDLVSPRRQGKHVFYALGPAAQCDEDGKMTLTADDATVTITPYRGG
jgi:DNA-binding transcriptional ArsR family regulator